MTISSASAFLKDNKIRRGNGEVRFTEIEINNNAESIDPYQETRMKFSVNILKDIERLDFLFYVFGSSSTTDPMTSSELITISNSSLKEGEIVQFEIVIPPNAFWTGLFSLYLWLGKKGELIADNYPYDLVDSLYHLNYVSNRPKEELGYNPLKPSGVFNTNFKLENIKIN